MLTVSTMAMLGASYTTLANDGNGIDTMPNVTVETMAEKTMYVQPTCGANVRTKPDVSGDIITTLEFNSAVKVDGKTSNGWYQVIVANPKGGESGGYISGDLLTTTKNAVPDVTPDGVNPHYTWIKETHSSNTSKEKAARGQMSHDNDTFVVNVQSGYLALRSAPQTDPNNEIAQIENGKMVHVEEYGEQFDYVYVPSIDKHGYVNNDYLKG